jgi:hypothetical protein
MVDGGRPPRPRSEGYASPQVVIDGRVTHLAWAGVRADPGSWVSAADNRSGTFAAHTFSTLGRDPKLAVAGGRARVAWTTLSGPGRPSKVFMASRDAGAAWAGRYVSPEAATDQNTAAIALTSDLTTLILDPAIEPEALHPHLRLTGLRLPGGPR